MSYFRFPPKCWKLLTTPPTPQLSLLPPLLNTEQSQKTTFPLLWIWLNQEILERLPQVFFSNFQEIGLMNEILWTFKILWNISFHYEFVIHSHNCIWTDIKTYIVSFPHQTIIYLIKYRNINAKDKYIFKKLILKTLFFLE